MSMRRTCLPRTRTALVALFTASPLLLAGCGGDGDAAPPASTRQADAFPVDVRGAGDSRLEIEERPERIVALFDVNVAVLDELDVDDRIVALDDFAAVPDGSDADLPRIGGDGFRFDAEAVVALEPDLVVTSTGTEAVLDEQLRAAGVPVLSLEYPDSVEATLDHVRTLGAATGTRPAAEELAAGLEEQVDAVAEVADDAEPVRTYYETDASVAGKPFTVGEGSLVHELLELAGATPVPAAGSGPAPQVSYEAIVDAAPQVILLANAVGHVGPNFLGAIEPGSVAKRPGFATVPAVADDRVHAVDADELLVPGPRIADGLAQLVGLLHPQLAREAEAAAGT